MKTKIYSTIFLILSIFLVQSAIAQVDQAPDGLSDSHHPTLDMRSASNCSTQSTVVDVYILPGDTLGLCPGDSLVLFANTDPDIKAWFWSTTPVQTTDTLLVTAPGTYTVIAQDSAGCPDTASAYVYQIPVNQDPLGGDTAFCAGDTLTFDLTSSEFVSFLWKNGDTSSVVKRYTASTIWVTITDTNSCTIRDTITLTRNLNPVVSVPSSANYCPGDTATLSATAGFVSYLWSPGNQTTTTIMVTTDGSYTCTVTDTNGCMGTSNAAAVTQFTPPAQPVITYNGDYISSTSASTYQWFYYGVMLTGATAQTLVPDSNGTYMVSITDANGCGASSDPLDVYLDIVVPRGASATTPIQLPGLNGYPDNKIVIFNRYGNAVFTKTGMTGSDTWAGTTDDGKTLPTGTYFYVLDLGDGSEALTGYIEFVR
ncbi:MAG: gliding motility-associated C-terminal domain-containing protein [Bacteroidia bacterium]|nr:gliding motility-associated C-terminal domain-containing protein [Bacteroidia bacterium]